jgi:FkbM family methyltransferase
MIKASAKRAITAAVTGLGRTRTGRHVYRHVAETAMSRTTAVRCRGHELRFATPNGISEYRVESLMTKEPETLDWIDSLPAGAVLWDIGANVGMYAVYAAAARRCRVYAFEPSVFNLELLARNAFLNSVNDRLTLVPLALSDARGTSAFKMSSTEWGGALSTFHHGIDQNGGILDSRFEYQTVGLSMDDAVDRLGLPQPRFVKVDVDGIEHFILRGGGSVLPSVDSVLIEINDNFVEQAGETARLLAGAGLSLYRKCDLGVPGVFNQWWRRDAARA